MNTENFKSLRLVFSLTGIFFLINFALFRFPFADDHRYFYGRVTEILDQARKAPLDQPSVLFFGASETALNVSPRMLQERLGGVGVYNFGLIMAGPDVVRRVAQELETIFSGRQKRVRLVVLRFSPMMFTTRYKATISAHLPLFAYSLPFLHLLRNSTWRDRYFLSRALYQKVTGGVGLAQGELQRKINSQVFFAGKEAQAKEDFLFYENIWSAEFMAPAGRAWDPSSGGEIDLYAGGGFGELAHVRQRALYDVSLLFHKYQFDCTNLEFDESLFRELNVTITELKKVADHVALLYVPEFYLSTADGPNAQARQRVLERIAALKKDSRISFWDYSDFPANNGNFFDLVHMTRAGKNAFNARLANSIREQLRR